MNKSCSKPTIVDPSRKSGRRSFLRLTSTLAGLLSFSTIGAAIARFCLPLKTRQLSSRILTLGRPREYPPGTKVQLQEGRITLLSTEDGFFAVSNTCTHLGCVLQPKKTGFICTCHGSYFNDEGSAMRGPAQRPLSWLRLGCWPNGHLYVACDEEVNTGTYFKA